MKNKLLLAVLLITLVVFAFGCTKAVSDGSKIGEPVESEPKQQEVPQVEGQMVNELAQLMVNATASNASGSQ